MSLPPFILAFDVASPGMLWWLAAAGVPILIHLWSRRRYREMYWAAMEYLLAALRSSRRRIRFEQLLLLLIRTLIVMLVVAAVAEPILEQAGFAMVTGERTHRVLVIDGSYSMGYQPTDKSRFERAKDLAAQIVEAGSEGDGYSLVLMSSPPRTVVAGPVFEPGDFLEEIKSLVMPHTSADLPATVARVEEILSAAGREHPGLTRNEVYFLTDLGRVGWLPGPGETAALETFRQRSRRLAESAALVVIDLGQSGAENLAVTDVRTGESVVTVSRVVSIEADLRSFGRQPRNRIPVDLLVNGRRVKQESVDLGPGAQSTVAFSYRFEAPGDHAVEVRVAGDQLNVDNHRWLALPVRQNIRVLCVDGRPSGTPFAGATDYLVRALAPYGQAPGQSVVHPDVVQESRLLETDLSQYDCLFLADVAQFTSGEARLLQRYLQGGGGVVFFLGDQVLADRYNRELFGGGPEDRILPAELKDVVGEGPYYPDPKGYRHRIVRDFESHEKSGLLNTPVRRYVKLAVPEDSPAEIALALDSGDPLIVEAPVGQGRVVLFATSADPSWTYMPKWHSYVPIVRETLAYVMGDQIKHRNLTVGEPLGASVPSATETDVTLRGPDGRRETVTPRREDGRSVWSYSDTFTSGVYTAEFGPPVRREDAYAVNVDTEESDLAKLTPEQLRDEVWPDVPFVHQTTWEDVEDEPVAQIARPGRLSKALLYALLVLLFAETYLARRFGYPSK